MEQRGERRVAAPFTCASDRAGLTVYQFFPNNLRDPLSIARNTEMHRRERQELERKLAQAHRLALEPTDALTREQLARRIEDLEFQLLMHRAAA